MKRNKKYFAKKKGFTLVELLIVIVIVGLLSAILMVAAIGAIDKAEATKIVSDLRNLQSASYLYFIDESKWPSGDITIINPYMSSELASDGKYSLVTEDTAIKVRYSNGEASAGLMRKLKEMQDRGSPISVDVQDKSAEIALNHDSQG